MKTSADSIQRAADLIHGADHVCVFTGAGISVESGIPPFRGEKGIYARHDPLLFEIEHFRAHPVQSWKLLHEIFYQGLSAAVPNDAHKALALLEGKGLIRSIVTQNIDHLHTRAGSRKVIHFHGTLGRVVCLECHHSRPVGNLSSLPPSPPYCTRCGKGILKPDIVFFGESIPASALRMALREATQSDLLVIIGSTGEVLPASMIPRMAKESGARIIEINVAESRFTSEITDIFLQGAASVVMTKITERFR